MSKLQDMPIMDRLYVGSQMDVLLGPSLGAMPIDRETYQWLASFKRVRLNDDERVATPKGDVWNSQRIFGHLMLPFPRLWIEWNNVRDDEGSGLPTVWMAAICESWKHVREHGSNLLSLGIAEQMLGRQTAPYSIGENGWAIQPLMLMDGRVIVLPMTMSVELDGDGIFRGLRGIDLQRSFEAFSNGQKLGPNTGAEDTATITDLAWDALVAVGWMNCRNVQLRQHDRSGNIGGSKRKRLRNQARSLDFHTIHLPGVDYESDGSVTAEHRDLRLHQVRGHFKTFTADAPLMGQHVGTYWWGWQVRGSKRNGVVVSDYKVGAPA